MGFYDDVIAAVVSGRVKTKQELHRFKQVLARVYHLEKIPSDGDILEHTPPELRRAFDFLKKKPTRSLSGVSVVAVMTKPWPCPGKCIYCPRGDAAQSYTGQEPAALRAKQNQFDPYRQVIARIRQLESIGHPTDKIEVIVMGGTFTSMPEDYQESFVLGIFNALNGKVAKDIEEAHQINETAKHRCVGLTFEVRPDFSRKEHINRMLHFGGTRVELGVQTVYDDVYEKIKRGHTVKDVVDATQWLKDSSFKVCYHMMPGLPYSSRERDLKAFKTLFDDPRFRPDMLKIYPTLLAKKEFYTNLEVWDLYESGEWKPLNNEEAADLIARALAYVPKYVRVMRIQRDIPAKLIAAGVTAGNLRQLVMNKAKELGIEIKEIRSREVGIRLRDGWEIGEPELKRLDYEASNGLEVFLSFEDDQETLFGFLRLRKPFDPFRPEISKETALIRELHVYGPEVEIGHKDYEKVQHKGLGRALVEEAERIAKEEWGFDRILVISGVGVRPYYRRLEYERVGPYMGKILR